jgi:hypothetical protein
MRPEERFDHSLTLAYGYPSNLGMRFVRVFYINVLDGPDGNRLQQVEAAIEIHLRTEFDA